MAAPDYPRIIAHRCGGALAPENSLAGLRAAAQRGIAGVEFDVMLSGDGVPLLMHDETLERTSDGRGRVADHDLAQIKRLEVFSGERIPTLAEAWQLCSELGLWANVEIKPSAGHEVETAELIAAFLSPRWRSGAGIVSSFSAVALHTFAELAPDIPRAMLVGDIPADWQSQLAHNGCVAVHCAARKGAVGRLEEVLAAGVPVACYTVNRRDEGDSLLAAGVTAIFSDRPDLW